LDTSGRASAQFNENIINKKSELMLTRRATAVAAETKQRVLKRVPQFDASIWRTPWT